MVVVDDDGAVKMANRAARELRGVDVESLFRWSPRRDPEMASFRAQLRVGSRASCEIAVPPAADGGVPRRIALEGRSHGPFYAIVLRDVTHLRRLEEETRHLRRLESVGYLTASVVHDFNNVLTAMVCSAGLLARSAHEPEASGLAGELLAAGERATGLVRRVMRVLRREPVKPDRVNLAEAVGEMRGLIAMLAGPAIDVRFELDAATADVVVDREQLDQVLLNLAANARDAMPRGGEIVVGTSNVSIGEQEAAAAGGRTPGGSYVALTVTDTGEGMTAEVRERVFERFFTTKDAGEGAGIGLASAHRFATDAGGCITVRSAPGAGTSVHLYLPRAPGGRVVELAPVEPEAPTANMGRETVLVIEADDHVRFVVRAALLDRGYFVLDAPTGDLALRIVALAERAVDLVLADVAAPGLSGRQVVQTLGDRGQTPALLWTSGLTDRATAERGVADEPILRKAFTPLELARQVREALDARSAAARPTGSV